MALFNPNIMFAFRAGDGQSVAIPLIAGIASLRPLKAQLSAAMPARHFVLAVFGLLALAQNFNHPAPSHPYANTSSAFTSGYSNFTLRPQAFRYSVILIRNHRRPPMPSLKCLGALAALVLASPAVAGEVCQPFDKGVKAVAEIAAQGKAQPVIIPPAKMEEFRAMMAKSGIKVYGTAAIILTGQTGTHALFVKMGNSLCRVLPVTLPPDKPAPAKEPERGRFKADEYGRRDV